MGVTFNPDGQSLVTVGYDGVVFKWEAKADATPESIMEKVKEKSQGAVTSVTFSPDGTLFATTGRDNTIILWRVGTDDPLPLPDNRDVIRAVAFSSDGNLMATTSNKTANIWSIGRKPISHKRKSDLRGLPEPVTALAVSQKGELLATASTDGKVQVWDVFSGQPKGNPLPAHEVQVSGVTFISNAEGDATHLVTASTDTMVRVWDISEKTPELLRAHTEGITALVPAHKGQMLATASKDRTVKLWKTNTREVVRTLPLIPSQHRVAAVAFEETEIRLAIVSTNSQKPGSAPNKDGKKDTEHNMGADKTMPVSIWNVPVTGNAPVTNQALDVSSTSHPASIVFVAFSKDSALLATASVGDTNIVDTAVVWDVNTGKPLPFIPRKYDAQITAMAFSPAGEWLAIASDDNTVKVWKGQTSSPLTPLKTDEPVMTMAFSPDGKCLATAGVTSTVVV